MHGAAGDGDDFLFDGEGLLDGGWDVCRLVVDSRVTRGHHLGRLADPEHLLVLAEVAVTAEGLLHDLARHHAEFAAVVGLVVHALGDFGDVLGGWG